MKKIDKVRNIKLIIEYDGTNYSGWQIQKGKKVKTIQRILEKALEKVLCKKISLIGAARTDAGVHARGQVANFKTEKKMKLQDLQKALNSLLPVDIVIVAIEEVPLDFHSRYSSRGKVYEYKILNSFFSSAFHHRFIWQVSYVLDIKSMQKGAEYFIGEYDFSSFCAARSGNKNKRCRILKFKIKRKGEHYIFLIEGTNFLYKMVRNIVGTLVEVGRGKFQADDIRDILNKRDRNFAGPTAPAKGLTLIRVKY